VPRVSLWQHAVCSGSGRERAAVWAVELRQLEWVLEEAEEWARCTLDCSQTVTMFPYLLSKVDLFSEDFQ